MTTLEIPRADWPTFFDRMTRLHLDEPIQLQVLRLDIGAQVQIDGLPLVGITVNPGADDEWIEVSAGADRDAHVSHRVPFPLHVHLLRSISDDDQVLQIYSADHTTTLLRFDAPPCSIDPGGRHDGVAKVAIRP